MRNALDEVEGMDIEVLQSSDWRLFRSSVVAVGDLDKQLNEPPASLISVFMIDYRYWRASHTVRTSLYAEREVCATRAQIEPLIPARRSATSRPRWPANLRLPKYHRTDPRGGRLELPLALSADDVDSLGVAHAFAEPLELAKGNRTRVGDTPRPISRPRPLANNRCR
jgi:hypothetical protein